MTSYICSYTHLQLHTFHHHSTGFILRFPKIYDIWLSVANKAIKNIFVLGGHSWPSWPSLSSWLSWWWSWYLVSPPFKWICPDVSKNMWYMGVCWKLSHQEHPCTWRTFLIFLIILTDLMAIKIPGVTTIQLDLSWGFQKYMIHGYLLQIKPSRTSLYLEDIPDLPDLPDHPDWPDVNHDTWCYHHSTGFVLRFPKIYETWVYVVNKAIKNILVLGGHSWSSW